MLLTTLPIDKLTRDYTQLFQDYIDSFNPAWEAHSDGMTIFTLRSFEDFYNYREKAAKEDLPYLNAFVNAIPLIARVILDNVFQSGGYVPGTAVDVMKEGLKRVFIYHQPIPIINNPNLNIKSYYDRDGLPQHYMLNAHIRNNDRGYMTHVLIANGLKIRRSEQMKLSDKLVFYVDENPINIITFNHTIHMFGKDGIYSVGK